MIQLHHYTAVWSEQMKIAIPTDNGNVAEHFGRCPQYTIVEIENNEIKNKEIVDNPGHRTGSIPKFLHEQHVDCVIVGGMGWRAQQFFDQFSIKTIVGVSGKIDDVIEQFVKGTLKGGESLCKPSGGKGYGIEKEDGHH